jgi:hypothetical protein
MTQVMTPYTSRRLTHGLRISAFSVGMLLMMSAHADVIDWFGISNSAKPQ